MIEFSALFKSTQDIIEILIALKAVLSVNIPVQILHDGSVSERLIVTHIDDDIRSGSGNEIQIDLLLESAVVIIRTLNIVEKCHADIFLRVGIEPADHRQEP